MTDRGGIFHSHVSRATCLTGSVALENYLVIGLFLFYFSVLSDCRKILFKLANHLTQNIYQDKRYFFCDYLRNSKTAIKFVLNFKRAIFSLKNPVNACNCVIVN